MIRRNTWLETGPLMAKFAVMEDGLWCLNVFTSLHPGPNHWNTKYSDYCNADKYPRQSPIDIRKGFLKYDPSLGKMRHEYFDTKKVLFQAVNNGHTGIVGFFILVMQWVALRIIKT
jgi:carbonic anhydrase